MTPQTGKPAPLTEKQKREKKEKEEAELSEQDKELKANLELMVERIQDPNVEVVLSALDILSNELKKATSSITSVPKPFKFLKPHYEVLVNHYNKMQKGNAKIRLADVLSVLATTSASVEGSRESLVYRLQGSQENFTSWGHEYIRTLSGQLGSEYKSRTAAGEDTSDLVKYLKEIVPFHMKHNSETDAVDLLSETDSIESIVELVDSESCNRVCTYLVHLAAFAATSDEQQRIYKVAFNIYLRMKWYPNALRVAIKKNEPKLIKEVVEACTDRVVKKQLALMMAGQCAPYDFGEDEELCKLASGDHLSPNFLLLAKELDVLEAKLPEDVYKSHLEEGSHSSAALDSAKQNLAATFVNGFVNAGFCTDKLMTVEGSAWLYKNKDHGMMSTAASLGLILLWNAEEGLSQIDKFQYSSDLNVKAGALLAFGISNCGVQSDCDPAYALLSEEMDSQSALLKLAAVVGLGYAYPGTQRKDLLENLIPIVIDTSHAVECASLAALSLGMIFIGSCNEDVAQAILQTLIERQATQGALDGPVPTFFAVGLGLIFLGSGDASEPVVAALQAITHPLGKYASLTVETCAFAGSGDVLKIQRMMHCCAEPASDDGKEMHHAVAVLGVPLIACGETIGSQMSTRCLDHVLQYGDLPLRRAVPLALALQSASHPKPPIIDTLSKLSHDADPDVALHSIISLGIVGAGTNNSRIAGLLRQLAAFYAKDANALFVVRIAQGLLYTGKGLLSMNPLYSDRFLMNPIALGSLIAVTHVCLHLKDTILGKYHYLLYHLAPALYPRMLMTVTPELTPLPVPVRVGQAINTVGQAGKPRSITGFQTHTTPVLLNLMDRAELATEEYIPVSPILEGVVILRKNPDYKPTGNA